MVLETEVAGAAGFSKKSLYKRLSLVDACSMEPPRFKPGTFVLWNRKKNNKLKVIRVQVWRPEKGDVLPVLLEGEVVILRMVRGPPNPHYKKKIVPKDSLTQTEAQTARTLAEEAAAAKKLEEEQAQQRGEQKQSTDTSVPTIFDHKPAEDWSSAAVQFRITPSDHFGAAIFNGKVKKVMEHFWTKRVRGDGWCLLHSVNEIIQMYGLPIHPYTKNDLKRIAREKQPDFDGKKQPDFEQPDFDGAVTIVSAPGKNFGKTIPYILADELDDPNNLSEAWVAFLAKELNCRFIIFTIQKRTDREPKPTMKVHSYTAREVLPYQSPLPYKSPLPLYSHTCYLYNTGHYWPLLPKSNIDVDELLKIWGNVTYKKPEGMGLDGIGYK